MPLPALSNTPQGKAQLLVLEIKKGSEHPYLVVVESEEHIEYYPDLSDGIRAARLTLHYRLVAPGQSHIHAAAATGTFNAGYDSWHNSVSITSSAVTGSGAVFVDPLELRGRHFGTYLMSRLVRWVQQWPSANLKAIQLLASDATPDNHARRNRFYEQFGIQFTWVDSTTRAAGESIPMTAGQLITSDAWSKNIVEHNLVDFLAQQQFKLSQLQLDFHSLQKSALRNLKEIDRRPFRYAIDSISHRYRFQLTTVGIVMILCFFLLIRIV